MKKTASPEANRHVLVTGATGYIGGRLVPRLVQLGYPVRCLARDLRRLPGRPWRHQVEWTEGDVLKPDSINDALSGIAIAYYLVHSLGSGSDFPERDVQAARHFGAAAKAAGIERIIYLGGLGDARSDLSTHLRSRQETGDALREAGVAVTEFRAGVIVGSGSLSFEMIRYLAERVPIMICPRWVYTRVQPIAIADVLDYLLNALTTSATAGRTIEIGGADIITYGQMLTEYARIRGLRRILLPVPVLTPKLSSYWIHLVTPIPASIAQPLVAGLRNEIIVRDDSARALFPDIQLFDYGTAVKRALEKLRAAEVETTWSDAFRGPSPVTLSIQDGMIIERRQRSVGTPASAVFRAISGIGGKRGWLYMNWGWRIRGGIDRLLGGVGMRRGRRDADTIEAGEALDFWRVEAIESGRLIRLRAEMKVPGQAWLQFEVRPGADPMRSLLVQTAFFAPKGLFGVLYWYALYPIHALIFRGMIERLVTRARELHARPLSGEA